MEIVYTLRIDAPYFKTLIDRYYRQRPMLLRLPARFGMLAIVVSCVYLWNKTVSAVMALGVSVVVAAVIFCGVALTKLAVLQRFKRRADFGTDVTVTLSTDGLTASSENLQGKWGWASYPRSVRYGDGILLLRAGVIRWLPDAAIVQGTAEQATALVISKTTLRRVATSRA
ncbi:MAG: hypothetical protein M3N50_05070 [Pseudomonadota bacterium]|nr:hypothetical protein [Pseudomonadota bacterium]